MIAVAAPRELLLQSGEVDAARRCSPGQRPGGGQRRHLPHGETVGTLYAGAFRGVVAPELELPPELLAEQAALPELNPARQEEIERLLFTLGTSILYTVGLSRRLPLPSPGRKGLIEQFIERNAHRSGVRIAELGAKLNLSPSRCSHLVRELFGDSLRNMLLRTRIDRAKRMLQNSDLSIKEISDTLGFANLGYFSRKFKSFEGSPPGRFRGETRREQELR